MRRLLHQAVRRGMQRGLERGVVEGNGAWIVLGGLALLAHLAGRAMDRQPQVVFSSRMEPGEAVQIIHEAR